MIKAAKKGTVIENMTSTLLEESSSRMRVPVEVAVKGLATLPRPKSTSALARPSDVFDSDINDGADQEDRIAEAENKRKQELEKKRLKQEMTISKRIEENNHLLNERKIRRAFILRNKDSALDFGKPKPSPENWVPEVTRLRSLHRDLAVAKENLLDIEVRETEKNRELRRFKLSDLERAHLEESLGKKKLRECGCCRLSFSYVNLPLSVSHKAVLDLRKSWTLNRSVPVKTLFKDDERLGAVPRCYDEVRVCTFCAQFFSELEKYRPSFDAMALEERRKHNQERERREREYWDPLKMCEKDRLAAEEQEKAMATMSVVDGRQTSEQG